MSDDVVQVNDKGLKQLLKAMGSSKLPASKVGVLGNKNTREGSGSNAEIGAKHEFGKEDMPIRSFLRMPITDQLQKFLEQSGAFTKEALAEVVRAGSLEIWMKKIGVTAEAVVAEAFNTGGFGQWKPSNMAHKQNKQTLVETQQLRNSITSETK